MKILLIEDMAGFATPIRQELEAQGHQVTWIIGAESINDQSVTGIIASRNAHPVDDDVWNGESDRLINVRFEDFDAALVDGGLIGPVKSGDDFVRALTQHGIPCVSITGGGAGIKLLADAGALAGVPKEFVLLALRRGVLSMPDVQSQRQGLAQALVAFTVDMRACLSQRHKGGPKFLTGFPTLDAAL